MSRNAIYRIYVSEPRQPITRGSLIGEFDHKIDAEKEFAEALKVHVAEIEKGVTRVSLIMP